MSGVQPAHAPGDARALFRIHTIGAGLVDVGASSAATFVCGLVAARKLDAHELGAYALAFRVLVVAMTVSTYLVFQPREVQAMLVPERDRPRLLLQGMKVGVPVAVLAALCSASWPLAFPSGVSPTTIIALNVTMCLVAVISPLQDYLRRMLHLSGLSWRAATVSGTQLLVVAVGWAIIARGGVRPSASWIPFGLLALANVISLAIGLTLSRRELAGTAPKPPGGDSGLMTSGGWLLVMASIPSVTATIVSIVVAQRSGPGTLGYLEAARLVAQPILVFAIGLSAVLGPRLVHAAQSRERTQAIHVAAEFSGAVLAAGVVYAVMVGMPQQVNVLAWLVPKAFTVPGVALLMLLAQVALSLSMPARSELMGAGMVRFLAGTEVLGGAAFLACVLLRAIPSIFAMPIGLLAYGVVRFTVLRVVTMQLYRDRPTEPSAALGL